jgi:hypothetical protein
MSAAAMLRRLVEGFGTCARVDEKSVLAVWTGDMKMVRRGVRWCSALSLLGYHRSQIQLNLSPKYCKYIVGSTAGTTFFTDLARAILQSPDA